MLSSEGSDDPERSPPDGRSRLLFGAFALEALSAEAARATAARPFVRVPRLRPGCGRRAWNRYGACASEPCSRTRTARRRSPEPAGWSASSGGHEVRSPRAARRRRQSGLSALTEPIQLKDASPPRSTMRGWCETADDGQSVHPPVREGRAAIGRRGSAKSRACSSALEAASLSPIASRAVASSRRLCM